MVARSIAERSAVRRVVHFSGRRCHSIQSRSGFVVAGDDQEDTIEIREGGAVRRKLPAKDRLIGAGPSDRNGWEKSRASSGRVGLKAVRGEPQNTKWVSFLGERGSSCERIPFV